MKDLPLCWVSRVDSASSNSFRTECAETFENDDQTFTAVVEDMNVTIKSKPGRTPLLNPNKPLSEKSESKCHPATNNSAESRPRI